MAFLSHLGYGASVAPAYPLLSRHLPGPPLAKGAAFGLLVWAFSYLGWLPATDTLPPSHKRPPRRLAIQILPHLLWGAVLAVLTDQVSPARSGR